MSHSPLAKPTHDVIIFGGGMVGATLACALGQLGLQVALIEAQTPRAYDPAADTDLRVSAVSLASEQIFRNLGIWSRFMPERISAYREMRVWNDHGKITFDAAEVPCPHLGHIIENNLIQWAAWQVLDDCPEVEQIVPATLTRLHCDERLAYLQLAGGRELRAPLLVGADGAQSRIRELAGIPSFGWSYDQQAIVANIRTEYAHQETAWQRFLPNGPLAFLPLADGRCSIVWSNQKAHAEGLMGLSDGEFCRALTDALQGVLGFVTEIGPRAAFPLQMRHARTYIGNRVALVGDAAHTIHPLAGQGANLGFMDLAALADVLREANQQRRDLGEPRILRRYERWRQGDNLRMAATMDGFYRLFTNQNRWLHWLRNTGLNFTDSSGIIKRQIMRQATGLGGNLPALAQARSQHITDRYSQVNS